MTFYRPLENPPKRQPPAVRVVVALLGVLAALAFLPHGAIAQDRMTVMPGAIKGRVTIHGTDQGLSEVEVRILGTSFRAVTDHRGNFRIDPTPPGDHVIQFSRMGYGTRSDTVRIPVGVILDVKAALAMEPIQLDELVVVAQSAVLERGGFYARQSQGYRGYFIDRQEIERRNPDTPTDLFQRMSGLRVIHGGLYGSQVFMNQVVTFKNDGSLGCLPSIWIDGIRSTMRTPDVMLVDEIEGIEVYKGASSPGKFNDLCGTIVIWTRQRISR